MGLDSIESKVEMELRINCEDFHKIKSWKLPYAMDGQFIYFYGFEIFPARLKAKVQIPACTECRKKGGQLNNKGYCDYCEAEDTEFIWTSYEDRWRWNTT